MTRSTLIWLAGSLLIASVASAQQPGRRYGDTTKAMQGQPMAREMMMKRMSDADARLDRLVSEMNRATGGKKVQAIAAVINELAAQRKQMREHMRQMMESGAMMDNGGGRRRGGEMMRNMQPQSADTAPARPTALDTVNHSQHHDTAR